MIKNGELMRGYRKTKKKKKHEIEKKRKEEVNSQSSLDSGQGRGIPLAENNNVEAAKVEDVLMLAATKISGVIRGIMKMSGTKLMIADHDTRIMIGMMEVIGMVMEIGGDSHYVIYWVV